ncbi:MAG TPA: N,N-dimethylformamidase beta subunit family domain-containing protein, partial [Micromonosporaceae bacterium]
MNEAQERPGTTGRAAELVSAVLAWPRRSMRRLVGVIIVAVAVVGSGLVMLPAAFAASDPCNPVVNPVVCENSKAGTPSSVWDIDGAGDPSIQGFATDISVNLGQRIDFKIKTNATAYTIDVYRLGWYNGDGARKIASVPVTASLPQTQPACITSTATEIYDCGNWAVSASWTVPTTAVSGVYIARLRRSDNGGDSHITFVVRDDASTSDVIFQTSDATWQAYNAYGGSDFYNGGNNGRAYKISYNRPFATRGSAAGRDFVFSNEYPMIRFLERNGYDISYTTNVDSERRGALIKNHKIFLSVGHDEYWSKTQRANVEAARDAGTHLAFFSGNEVYWKTRYEPSQDGTNTAYRTIVCYKETWANAKIDPSSEWTGTWRDPRFSPPADGGRPENGLTGTMFMVNDGDLALTVKAEEGKYRLWRNTNLTNLATGTQATLAQHTVGYESNEDRDNGFRPQGLIRLSTTTGSVPQVLQDFGNKVLPGTTTHNMTLYRAASGALVFSAGTIQYAWGVDDEHDGATTATDSRMQQAVINLFADMGVQPATLMSGLVAASASTDGEAPTVSISSPAAGATVARGSQVTLTGTATEVGGGRVAGVEVSTDDGASWHPATGTTSWTYKFYAAGLSTQVVRVRAVDDSVNVGQTPATREFQLSGPSTMFGQRVPKTPAVADTSPVELGVRFKPTVNGYVTGIRFYKGSGNTGTHTGTLWTAGGTPLATGTFTGESSTGWQTMTFANPAPVLAGTTYVASYFAPTGNYAADEWVFAYDWLESPPLVAPRSTASAGNGVYVYGGNGGFPTAAYGSANYYVDVTFATSQDLPPVVTSTSPLDGAGEVPVTVQPSAVFSKSLNPASITFTLTKGGGGSVTGTVGYNDSLKTVTFTPSVALDSAKTYTATVTGSDSAGRSGTATWSFFTEIDAPVYTLFATTAVPTTVSHNDPNAVELGVKFKASVAGQIIGIRFYQGPGNTGSHPVTLWNTSGTALATATVGPSTDTGWRVAYFTTPVNITANTTYIASYYAPNGHYAGDNRFFASTLVNGPLTAPSGTNGVYK